MKNPATPMELTTMKIQKTLPINPEVLGTNLQPCKLVLPQNSLKFMVVAEVTNSTGKLPTFGLFLRLGCHCLKISVVNFNWYFDSDIIGFVTWKWFAKSCKPVRCVLLANFITWPKIFPMSTIFFLLEMATSLTPSCKMFTNEITQIANTDFYIVHKVGMN